MSRKGAGEEILLKAAQDHSPRVMQCPRARLHGSVATRTARCLSDGKDDMVSSEELRQPCEATAAEGDWIRTLT